MKREHRRGGMHQTDGVSRERRSRSFESAGSSFEIEENRANRNGSYLFSLLLFAVGFAVVGLLLSLVLDPVVAAVAALVAAVFAASSVRVAMSWERVVITRLGTVQRVVGPGLYCVIPFVESASMSVDQRIITTSFTAEEALTSDLVPVDVDAVVFWMVWNAKKACMEVQDYPLAVAWAAQTALRDEKSQDWGITIASVEIRNIIVPAELQDALSKEAQAEREKNARILLAEVEKDISEMFVEAAETYDRNEKALHLRTLSAVAESTREKGGLVIAPSSIGDVFANLDAFSK